jgi:hypothetical protein
MYCPLFLHRAALCVALVAFLASCDAGDATAPGVGAGTPLALTTAGLPALDAAREGAYEAWVIDGAGRAHSAGRVVPTSGGIHLESPADDGRAFLVTVEPPGDTDDQPSAYLLLRGEFRGGRAELTVVDAITRGEPLKETPGTFTMFTPSDNHTAPYPSHEEAGVWLFNVLPRETPQNDMWVRLARLHPGWTYEGWMVRDLGTANEIWLSYGKFVPDATGALSEKDDTGWGPFSGVIDFRTAGVEEFPGDD